MAVQHGLCLTSSEAPKTGFLTTRLICYSTYLVLKQGEECQGKGYNKQHKHDAAVNESVQTVFEHHNVDAESWKLLHEQSKVDPTQEYCHHADIPLPTLEQYRMSLVKTQIKVGICQV